MAVAQAPARPKTSGGRLFTIIGVVLFVVGFGAAVWLGNFGGGKGGALTGSTLKVVYAAKDISLRTQISTQDQVVVKQVPEAYKPTGAIVIDNNTKTADETKVALAAVQGKIAEVNIAAGQPLLTSMLATSADSITGAMAAFLPIPPGYVAFTLPTSEQVGVAGYIQPGDYIAVTASQGAQKTAATVTIFTQLHVIRVGPANLTVSSANGTNTAQSSAPAQSGANATSITVIVTPCQAEYLIWFSNNTNLKYVLESYKDYAPAVSGPDPSCKNVDAAKGVQATDIAAKFPAFNKAFGQ